MSFTYRIVDRIGYLVIFLPPYPVMLYYVEGLLGLVIVFPH